MSTGYRINRASDDAAGLNIASKLNTQIRGLKQAQNNILNSVSLLNTAEGYLGDMRSMVMRIRDLATQGANGVYDNKSRDAMQLEADALLEEIMRIQNDAAFNGKNIFLETPAAPAPAPAPAPARRMLAATVPVEPEVGSVETFNMGRSLETGSIAGSEPLVPPPRKLGKPCCKRSYTDFCK